MNHPNAKDTKYANQNSKYANQNSKYANQNSKYAQYWFFDFSGLQFSGQKMRWRTKNDKYQVWACCTARARGPKASKYPIWNQMCVCTFLFSFRFSNSLWNAHPRSTHYWLFSDWPYQCVVETFINGHDIWNIVHNISIAYFSYQCSAISIYRLN